MAGGSLSAPNIDSWSQRESSKASGNQDESFSCLKLWPCFCWYKCSSWKAYVNCCKLSRFEHSENQVICNLHWNTLCWLVKANQLNRYTCHYLPGKKLKKGSNICWTRVGASVLSTSRVHGKKLFKTGKYSFSLNYGDSEVHLFSFLLKVVLHTLISYFNIK